MKRWTLPVVAALALRASTANAGPEHRIVVAGSSEDPIAAGIEKELTALGFQTVRVGPLDGCARNALAVATADTGATAATCSDGEQVGIWITDGTSIRLRDVVVSREDAGGRETTAVRAAEVVRATIALREAPESVPQPAAVEPVPMAPVAAPPAPERAPPPKPTARKTPRFAASAGVGALMGIDASVGSISGQIEVGIHRRISATARVEIPFESQTMQRNGSSIEVMPALLALGANVPIAAPTSFIIPRFGGGVGAIVLRAHSPLESAFDDTRGQFPLRGAGGAGGASPCGYLDAGLSMRIFRPIRISADGLFGTTLSRLVVRDDGTEIAYWGQPFGALALRLEVMIP